MTARGLCRRRKRSPFERGNHGGGTQCAVSVLFAGAESVASNPLFTRPRNRLVVAILAAATIDVAEGVDVDVAAERGLTFQQRVSGWERVDG